MAKSKYLLYHVAVLISLMLVDAKEMNLMVVGGYGDLPNAKNMVTEVEVLDPFSPESHCEAVTNFPDKRYAMVGEFFGGHPTVCGGYSSMVGYSNECFVYRNNIWTNESFHLTSVRADTSSIIVDDEMIWITGGIDGRGNASTYKTSDLIFSSGAVKYGVEMPEYIAYHCTAKVNSTHIFIAGNGYWDGYKHNAYLVDTSANPFAFTKLPPMLHSRWASACAVIDVPNEHHEISAGSRLFVVGGWDYPSSSEMYIISEDRWINGPDLPRDFSAGGYVTYPDERGFILVGGSTIFAELKDDILRYNMELNSFEVLPGKLQIGREYFASMLIETENPC